MRVIQHRLATAEIGEAARYYEQRVTSLGAQFLDEVDDAVRTVVAMPKCWPIIERDIRRYSLRRFPFSLYYRIGLGCIQILACSHHSRHPGEWRPRLGDIG